MKTRLIAVIVIFLTLGGFAYWKLYGTQEKGITATGTIEITKVDIAPKVGGYLSDLEVQEGDSLKSGKEVAKISRPDLESQLLQSESALEHAQFLLKDMQKGAQNDEVRQAEANLASAQSVNDRAKQDYERYLALYQQGAISKSQLDAAESSFKIAASALVSAKSGLRLIRQGPRVDQIAAQQQEVARNQAIVEASRTALNDTVIINPMSGIVLSKNYEKGEFVNPGATIVTVGDLNDCWVKIYIASNQLGLIRLEQKVNIRIDSYPNRVFHGWIKEISQSAEFTPRQSITQEERANLVFGVKVKVENSEGILKPGMPADVVIQ